MHGSLMLDIAGTCLTAEDRQLLRAPQVGGLILFGRNVEHPRQVRELCTAVRRVRPDLLLAIDQEGGRVQRLRRGVVRLPAMRDLGRCADAAALARECAWLMATEMLACGLDLSFAPVLDVDYGRNTVIASRAFADNAAQIAQLAGAFIDGLHEAGMAACGKHFPGHGWADADSHVAIPRDERSLEAIRQTDMQAFSRLSNKLDAVMPAHVIYPQVDEQPAGFSSRWLQGELRGQLGFSGVIFSDDLSMAGAHVAGDAAARIEAALVAGCDMGLVCNDRAAAELALVRLQQLKVTPAAGLARMRRRQFPGVDYQQSPRWQAAVVALRSAQLLS